MVSDKIDRTKRGDPDRWDNGLKNDDLPFGF